MKASEARELVAIELVLDEVASGNDFGDWLARVLSVAAANLGSPYHLVQARSGSWEAHHVISLAGLIELDRDMFVQSAARLVELRGLAATAAAGPGAGALVLERAAAVRTAATEGT